MKNIMKINSIKIVLGSSLDEMINGKGDANFKDWLPNIYYQIMHEFKYKIPDINLLIDNSNQYNQYKIYLDNSLVSSFTVDPKCLYALKTDRTVIDFDCFELEPAFGIQCKKIFKSEGNMYLSKGCNVVNAYQLLSTDLTQKIRKQLE